MFYTTIPIIVYGLFDEEFSPKYLMEHPAEYK